MTNNQTQSGPRCPHSNLPASECVGCLDEAFRAKRPPNATRPNDAELVKLLRYAARNIPASLIGARMLDAADALDAAPAPLTQEQWQEAVERAARENYRLNSAQNGDRREWSRARPSTKTGWKITTAEALRAAFPHLAPNPED